MIDLIINFGLRVLDFFMDILSILFTFIFSILQPLLWVIIPLFILNKILAHFGYSFKDLIPQKKKKTTRKKT